MLGTFVSLVGFAGSVAGLCSFASTISTRHRAKDILNKLDENQLTLDQLNREISYTKKIIEIEGLSTKAATPLEDANASMALLSPVQHALNEPIVSTALVETSTKLRDAFSGNPFDLLLDVRPFEFVSEFQIPGMVAIRFELEGRDYIGWQKKHILPFLFDCKLETSIVSNKNNSINSEQSGSIRGLARSPVLNDWCNLSEEIENFQFREIIMIFYGGPLTIESTSNFVDLYDRVNKIIDKRGLPPNFFRCALEEDSDLNLFDYWPRHSVNITDEPLEMNSPFLVRFTRGILTDCIGNRQSISEIEHWIYG